MLEAIPSPPYEKVNDVMESLVFAKPEQKILEMVCFYMESKVGLEDMVQHLDFQKEQLKTCKIT